VRAPWGWLAFAALLVPGCGDPDLWERWQAERAFLGARRIVERVRVQPELATDAQWQAGERAFRRISERWPASRWLPRSRARGPARDVALIAGRSAIEAGRLLELRGRAGEALEVWARAELEWGSLPEVGLEIEVVRARAYERMGRDRDALEAWIRLSALPLADDPAAGVFPAVLDAPLLAARGLAAGGRERAADSLLELASARYRAALRPLAGSPAAPEVLLRLSDARASLGDLDGALAALRAALAEPAGRDIATRLVLALAQRSLEFGRPESALVYTAWIASQFGGRGLPSGMVLEARAREALGPADSALAAWQRVLDAYPDLPESAAEARFRRGEVYERDGRWEPARSEWRALAASQPGHALALEALVRIALHHAGRGEDELARIEARRGVEILDQLIATHHDPDVSFGAQYARARLMTLAGPPRAAADALVELWREAPFRPEAAAAALQAADLVATELGDRAWARALAAEVAERAFAEESRRAARETLTRLGATPAGEPR
jgi:tetratricopeptide (TPR) repeat protein